MDDLVTDLRLVVFDCDGTLVDSQHAIIHSMKVAFSRYNLSEPSRDEIRRIVGLPLSEAIALLAPGASAELVDNLRVAYSDEWQIMRTNDTLDEPLFPGILEVIDRLSDAGWLLGVATGKSYRGLVATLSYHGILEKFVTLQTSDKVSRGKPYPDMLLAALNEAGVDANQAVMIGDTTFDIDMSQNAGVRAIGVNWGYHDAGALMASGAECVIDRIEDLLSVINPNTEK